MDIRQEINSIGLENFMGDLADALDKLGELGPSLADGVREAVAKYAEKRNMRRNLLRCTLYHFCIESPSLDLVQSWLESDSIDLQEWVLNHLREDYKHYSGIVIIEAAKALTEQGDST